VAGAQRRITVTHSLSKNLRITVAGYRANAGFTGAVLGVYGGNGTGWPHDAGPLPIAPLTLYVAMSGYAILMPNPI
jgi:hypothetical protein